MSEDFAEIDALYSAWSEAFRRGDVATILKLVTPDYALWAPGLPPIQADALRPQLEAAFAAYEVELVFERAERFVSGDLAVDFGFDVQTLRPRGGGPELLRRQRVVLVLRRGADSVWRFARGVSQPGPGA